MLSEKLKNLSKATYVDYGYGQVEPNHLSARRTGQIYAQLPANADIDVLENGQYVKYDYAAGEVNFTGKGEWMLVFNEIKLYRDEQVDCEFAMRKTDYVARVYSPSAGDVNYDNQSRFYNDGTWTWGGADTTEHTREQLIRPEEARDDWYYTEDPFHYASSIEPKLMKEGTTMVPRVLKTNVGDIYTTNTIMADELNVGNVLSPNAEGYLATDGDGSIQWEVVKLYTMPDGQKGVKIVRIA